jgi:hypothetical protein
MRILFVAPHPFSSGEAMTALHSAAQAVRRGASVRFFASPRSAQVLARQFPGLVTEMTTDGLTNRGLVAALVAEFRPEAIVFCDYALLPSSAGGLPLVHDAGDEGDAWIDWLDDLDAELFTFDHMGLEQPGSTGRRAGSSLRRPARMRVLLPCPMHEPSPLPGRRGVPVRCWTPRRLDERERAAARGPFAPPSSGYLVIHAVSSWAWEVARARRSPYYDLLPSLLESYFADFPGPVTIVSINNGSLLRDAPERKIRIVNLSPLAVDEHERLLASADLVLTENCFSSTLAKAVCFGVPGVAWQNRFDGSTLRDCVGDDAPPALAEVLGRAPASIEPWLVFPLLSMDWQRYLRVLDDNTIGRAFLRLEIFGGPATSEALRGLLVESPVRRSMEEDGRRYARSMGHLPDFHDALKEAPSA